MKRAEPALRAGLAKLGEEGIRVVSFFVDPLEKAAGVVSGNNLQFPVGYGASVDAIAESLVAYYEPKPTHTAAYLQSTGFALGPAGRVLIALCSSGAIGRLVWQDVLGLVKYVKAH